jgi:hypothetical protein
MFTEVSELLAASIVRVANKDYETTRRDNPEDNHLQGMISRHNFSPVISYLPTCYLEA